MIEKKIELAGRELKIETGTLAKQASGSVLVTMGETVVLVAVTANPGVAEDRGFFPLSVDYREKFYASGRIPGGFFKREARPSESEIIACRITDRPLRPLFPKGFYNEVQVAINVLSYDGENEADLLGTIGASTALAISDIPWDGPVASVRVGKIDGKYVVNPSKTDMEESEMEVIVSGTEDSIIMVEGEANFISEDTFLSGIMYAHEAIKDIISMQNSLVEECGKEKRVVPEVEINLELHAAVDKAVDGKISDLNKPKNKFDRYGDVRLFTDKIVENLSEEYPEDESSIRAYIDELIRVDLRNKTLNGERADGRNLTDIRDITIDNGLLPRAHGSSVFTRGETQALVITTLGSKKDEQMLDNIDGVTFKQFMLHYNFPPYCVGEARPKFSTSRREIGHGNLAERAIKKVLPSQELFPYTIRIVSEILESNGSSSMATVCGGIMSLMDAGVPISAPVAGIAMGLILEDVDNYAILTDILGTEDHLGDMDFKVAGSKDGITAIQMDLKIPGLQIDLLRKALQQALEGRKQILDTMNTILDKPRDEISKWAPQIRQTVIPVEKIGGLIGPGGKNIKALCEKYECEINIDDDGSVKVFGSDLNKINEAMSEIDKLSIVPKPGQNYDGQIVKVLDFGAFVEIGPGISGMIHISELKWERVNKVTDVLKLGEDVKVKLINIDDSGRLNFSIKQLSSKPEGISSDNRSQRNSGPRRDSNRR
ncbi:MAG: polyribonucleotide nucleotidyltransferase [Candidatus Marinimicrobia bacterium]|jgi:polyribonucleotide nucleotidyltransferase|nr:polyribonucleotide nucleotidyltransferase [Candidatus Neomarinimicrobiota bacterium]MBT3634412.1 polyribonucleotide nucleotidyltransferase [Candidatus Neomarinimicrobiota bacterium]MBT3683239.1 polyribonucleotide nucleotidyltransferase [Candidatus Neomarinimicrobiota bacterium]MBT3760127.1 polyribonucleotide nucleotidyltransferase [Candidatus Neomarinimicrobiota bacterium]MBT3896222.1 polyribonucleotide nucleotidyltransferase [Candidatus Neomarinimicrobiota bacterium]